MISADIESLADDPAVAEFLSESNKADLDPEQRTERLKAFSKQRQLKPAAE